MSRQYATSLRNTWLDNWEAAIGSSAKIYFRTGAPPANCAAADTGTLLVEFDLVTDWAGDASAGAKTLNGLQLSANAVADGVVGHYRIKDSSGTTCYEQGTVTATGGGGDVTIQSTTITNGHEQRISAWTITAPGA